MGELIDVEMNAKVFDLLPRHTFTKKIPKCQGHGICASTYSVQSNTGEKSPVRLQPPFLSLRW